ncbi:MAG: hypothetical protein M0C28_43240 [Candidatus Moduliflexus flocculans]|nr:hypothetical protein [Candidatus Moduliflexus flocculans]
MSRVGKKPITIPAGVTVTVHPDRIDFEGKKGKLDHAAPAGHHGRAGGRRASSSPGPTRTSRPGPTTAWAGPWPATPSPASSEGYVKQLEIVGVGYKAKVEKGKLEISPGLFPADRLRHPRAGSRSSPRSPPCSPSAASTGRRWARWPTTSRASASRTPTSRRASATSARG